MRISLPKGWSWLLAFTFFPGYSTRAGDFPVLTGGQRVVLLQADQERVFPRYLRLAAGPCRFDYEGPAPTEGGSRELVLRNKDTSEIVRVQANYVLWDTTLNPGRYEVSIPRTPVQTIPLTVTKETPKYPVITVNAAPRSFSVSPKRVKAGLVRFRFVVRRGYTGTLGLYGKDPKGWKFLYSVRSGGKPAEMIMFLRTGSYRCVDVRSGHETVIQVK